MPASGGDPTPSTTLSTTPVGLSLEGREIVLHHTQAADATGGTLLIGGIHGDEQATVLVLESFLERFLRPGLSGDGKAIGVIALANPDGWERATRYNARGVDLNRNFSTNWTPHSEEPSGSGPLSEPESRALHELILNTRPARIVSLHWALAEIDADGPQSSPLAFAMWEAMNGEERAPYRIRVWENAPGSGFTTDVCPGSLGQWCGYELQYPGGGSPAMVTLELPYDPRLPRPEVLPADHLLTLREAWAAGASHYMSQIEGPIHKMLLAACGVI